MSTNSTRPQSCLFITYNRKQIQDGRAIYIVAGILATLCILSSIVLNSLLIRCLGISTSLRKPSTLLLYSLAVSNLLMGLVLQPVYLVKKIAELQDNFDLYCVTGVYAYVIGYMLATACLFNLTALAVDRAFIVHWGLRYPIGVTQRRMYVTVFLIWALSVILSTGQLYMPRSLTFPFAGGGMGLCVLVTTACYVKILLTLRKRTNEVSQLSEMKSFNNRNFNKLRYGKTTITMLFVFVVFIICYLPYFCTMIAGSILGESFNGVDSAETIVTVIAYLKSVINPVVLLWRINEIQRGLVQILRRFVSAMNEDQTRTQATVMGPVEPQVTYRLSERFGNSTEINENGKIIFCKIHPDPGDSK